MQQILACERCDSKQLNIAKSGDSTVLHSINTHTSATSSPTTYSQQHHTNGGGSTLNSLVSTWTPSRFVELYINAMNGDRGASADTIKDKACFHCGILGHIRTECNKRKAGTQQTDEGRSFESAYKTNRKDRQTYRSIHSSLPNISADRIYIS